MKVGLIQYSPDWENRENNIIMINELIADSKEDTDLLILPELTLTGFTMQSEKFAEDIDGISTKYFIDLAQKTKKHIFAGLIERYEDKFYNNLIHFDNYGLITARYRKIHPFTFANEEQHYSAGDETVITKIDKIQIGLSICYDLRFPELYRYYAKEKVEIIINIANWPVKRIEHWRKLIQARAIENQCYFIGVNRIGKDPSLEYNGHSCVVDPMGNFIAENEGEQKIITAEIDFDLLYDIRQKLPFLNDIKLM
ncbi:MAG: carbon-nitrogen family hydrolase [Melioribacteraceae bacterium]|nr:carbon-nitrogen family hydrolase [Melioribacteraceae bacterium]MCF8355373.1 carbon-nitrogen family hydrolase [Melioribacteraceae bacterium]MCF8394618.1 carbon-nitrogen family hydrolase [Melioribacteraceae bacterium]MCF8419615.1 carbon-nitrogen family hydrolase [Melioribacteraceae bacterium]